MSHTYNLTSDVTSDEALSVWEDLGPSILASMQDSMPGVTECVLTGMEPGSVVVDYEVVISTKAAAEQIADPNSNFAEVDMDALLSDTGSLIEDVLTDDSFVNAVFEQVATARADAGKAAIEVNPDFVPTAAAKPIDFAAVFEDSCVANCAADEVLFHLA